MGPRGRQMIFDADPVEVSALRGLWRLTGEDQARAATREDLDKGRGPFYTSHFATCTDAAAWRRRKKAPA